MASLYFADQKKKKAEEEEEEIAAAEAQAQARAARALEDAAARKVAAYSGEVPDRPLTEPSIPPSVPQPMSFASSAVAPMSVMGNDGIGDDNVVLDAHVEPMSVSAASSLTEQTRQVPKVQQHHTTGHVSPGVTTASNLQSNENEELALDKEKKYSRLFIIGAGALCCLVLVGGIGAGVAVALRNNNSNGNQEPIPATPSPLPIKPQPTDKPIPTHGPTQTPTESPESQGAPPSNDRFEDAQTISTTSTVFGSTASATRLDASDPIVGTCGIELSDGPGLWYQLVGEGSHLRASTCGSTDFDTKLSVFSYFADTLECVGENDNGGCGVQSDISWLALQGGRYYLLVNFFKVYVIFVIVVPESYHCVFGFVCCIQVRGSSDTERGVFQLSLEPKPLDNDNCEGAILVEPDGDFILGSTEFATIDYVGICDVDTTAPGLWYRVEGTGGRLIFSTCHGTAYDTKLSVFTGSGCGSLVCVAGNDDTCDVNSRVEIDSALGKTYFVLIHGYMDATGVFSLQIATPENLYNDYCADALNLPLDTYVTGNNILARLDFVGGAFCDNSILISGPTVWFSVIGNGGVLRASTCDAETSFDTQLSVFKGSCSSLICIGGNDDSTDSVCGFTSEITWDSKPFETYLIAVGEKRLLSLSGFASSVSRVRL